MVVLLLAAFIAWLVLVAHGLLQLRGWIERAWADIEVQLAHQETLVQQAASPATREAAERALTRVDAALAGAHRYYNALVQDYNRRLVIPPGPLVARLAGFTPFVIR